MQARTGTSGVDWGQAPNIGKSCCFSPMSDSYWPACCSWSLQSAVDPRLYKRPEGDAPPPFWIRALLILTCTGVSFFHGSNDGQKGMGLIMLILIGTVPTAYALNHAITPQQSPDFVAVSQQAANTLDNYVNPNAVVVDPRDDVTALRAHQGLHAEHHAGAAQPDHDISNEVVTIKELNVPYDQVRNFRNDMYLVSEALRLMQKSRPARGHRRRLAGARQLQEADRPRDQVHPRLGEGGGGAGARSGYDDRLEAHRRHRRREDRQRPPDLRTGRRGGNHRHADHRRRRLVWLPGKHDARAVVGRGGNHGGQSHRPAVGDSAEPAMAWVLTLPVSILLSGTLFWAFKYVF